MRLFRRFAKILIPILLVSGTRLWAQGTSTPNHQLWKADLRQFGYQKFSRQSLKFIPLAVDFADEEHIAIAWISPDATKLIERKATKLGEPAHLHLLVLDARTGRKYGQKDWSTEYSRLPLLLGTPNGQFLICIGDSLRFVSPNLDLLREQKLPEHGTCSSTTAQLSPSRRTLLLSIHQEKSYYKELLNVEALTVLSAWTEPRVDYPDRVIAFSDNWIAHYCGEPREICLRQSRQKEWRPLRSEGLDTRTAKGGHVPVRFLSDELLAIAQERIVVATVRGDVLFQIRSPKDHFLHMPITSAGGERFAAIEYRFRGLRSPDLDMYPFQADDRVLVYDIKNRRTMFSLQLRGTSPWTPWNTHINSAVLPPNSTSLAVLSDTVLTLYMLSDTGADQQQ